jgi:hypothetical protein
VNYCVRSLLRVLAGDDVDLLCLFS